MASLPPPSAWADAEREPRLASDGDPTPFPRQPVTVTVTWTTSASLDLDPWSLQEPLRLV